MSLDWDVRALEPKTCSTTVVEGNRTEVVINNRFPPYLERSGDMPYMLETGLLEEIKPTAEEDKTVSEYHEQVTEALLESLRMQDTLRRRT
jgi:hypothetical protein